jgi:hypothetical protein
MRLLFILALALSAAAGGAAAAPLELEALARHPTWLRLLHYDRAGDRSEINSAEFFLAPDGARDPRAELRATLEAFAEPWTADGDAHPRCRFPARYFWLAQQGLLDVRGWREPRCRKLERWAQFDRVRSLSLLLVSGYFGNPASSFGHSLLKFNTLDGEGRLLDLSFNFGALVPENEWVLRYVVRGLTGGYESGFSDRYFYTQDLVYARTEFRDMWDYELALTDAQRTLLVLHLWEVIGKKFTYYFLTKNCAYRLAELIELATGRPFTARASVWYVPVELFHRLHALDAEQPGSLIRSLRFVPSSQRVLYHQFDRLRDDEAALANTLIAAGGEAAEARLAPLAPARQVEVADALIAYYEYRLAAEEPKPAAATRTAKDAALRLRLQLPPASDDPAAAVPALRSPAQAGAPMMLGAGAGWDSAAQGYLRLRWAPFYWDLIGDNGLGSGGAAGELVVMDTVLGADRHRAFVERVDLIRARKLSTVRSRIDGESDFSWQTQVGFLREWRDGAGGGRGRPLGFARMGIGYAATLARGVIGYAMLDGMLQTDHSVVAAEPNAGLIAGGEGRWRAVLRGGARYEFAGGRWLAQGAAEFRWQLDRDLALRIDATRDRATRIGAGLQAFF